MDAIETFEAERVAGRILGMGDIVSLVERAQDQMDAEALEELWIALSRRRNDLPGE